MNIEANIRKLARSSYYQNIYNASKECYGINLFENNKNFSGLQSLFLYWLKVYDFLFTLLMQKEYDCLQEWVIEDDVRCDAFLLFHRIEQNKKITQMNKESQKLNKKGSDKYEKFPIYRGPQNKGEES